MVDVDTYTAGTPCWVELATTDIGAAREFYGTLFGWAYDEGALPDGDVYVIPHLRDRGVAGMYEQRAEQKESSPTWLVYVAVNDADDTASRVTAMGGSLTGPPFDVMDSGRMAVLHDPAGAMIALWQARNSVGSRVVNEPGAFAWSELATRDPAGAVDFYGGLFGWRYVPDGDPSYTQFQVDGRPIAGMLNLDRRPGDEMPHWLAYFAVADCDAAAAAVGSNGGRVDVQPFSVDVGRIAVVADPQGARFGIWTGTPT